jgi:molecular chaperone GrpE
MPSDIDRDQAVPPASDSTVLVEELRRRLQDEQDRYLRLLAEFDTFRRRSARDQDAAVGKGRLEALRPLLAVLDALDEALATGSSDAGFYDGVLAIERLFVSVLAQMGVEPIDSAAGTPFDPHLHDAIATAAEDSVAPGTIVRTARRGWRYRHELVRPAQVVVAAAPQGREEHPQSMG